MADPLEMRDKAWAEIRRLQAIVHNAVEATDRFDVTDGPISEYQRGWDDALWYALNGELPERST